MKSDKINVKPIWLQNPKEISNKNIMIFIDIYQMIIMM